MSLGILRLQEGLDYSEYNDIEEITEPPPATNGKKSRRPSFLKPDMGDEMTRNVSSAQLSQGKNANFYFNLAHFCWNFKYISSIVVAISISQAAFLFCFSQIHLCIGVIYYEID